MKEIFFFVFFFFFLTRSFLKIETDWRAPKSRRKLGGMSEEGRRRSEPLSNTLATTCGRGRRRTPSLSPPAVHRLSHLVVFWEETKSSLSGGRRRPQLGGGRWRRREAASHPAGSSSPQSAVAAAAAAVAAGGNSPAPL